MAERVLAALAGIAIVLVIAFYVFAPEIRSIQCDGSVPRWMIEAQDYNGGGCAEVFPTSEAPVGADWSPYCLGYCTTQQAPGSPPFPVR